VRRLAAVESLGATTVICADKTGTLTENRMTVHSWHVAGREYRHRNGDVAAVTGNGDSAALAATPTGRRRPEDLDPAFERALMIGVLCNEAELDGNGSSTEGALLRAARDMGLDYKNIRESHPLLSVRPRITGENWMATTHAGPEACCMVAVKGAPEEVVERATRWLGPRGQQRLTGATKRRILAANARIAARGMRVLGLAFKEIDAEAGPTYDDLVWVGLVGLADPVRAGVREAIAACRSAGIRTVILTGDQAHTAAAIWRELDVAPNGHVRVLEASRLDGGHEAALRSAAGTVDVFARVSPVHKYHIVRALRAAGEVVAMTGDGINDAAALKASDIGVAMGVQGTAVARDVADAVLLEDDFGSIVRAVQHGRSIRDNISRALRFLLSTNFSEILVTLGALALGVARPLSAIQLLWINVVSDVLPALALAIEPPESDVMARPPRDPAEPILSRPMLTRIAGEGTVLAAATLGVYGLALSRYGAGPRATTLAFTTLTASQLAHALSCRSRSSVPVKRLPGGLPLLAVVGGSLGFQTLAVTAPPLRRLLGTTLLSLTDWIVVAGGITVPLMGLEVKRLGVRSMLPVNTAGRI
jgi:Ca2+-transporting ATPase